MSRVLVYVLTGIAISIAAILVFLLLNPKQVEAPETEASITPPGPVAEQLETRLLFGGDVFWGRLFEREAPNDYAFPFSGLDTIGKDDYDAWIANVECPITDEVVAFDLQWEAIQFNCRPEYLEEAAKWFDIVSLANNHTDNVRGEDGLFETREYLEEAGIQHFGHYEPGVKTDLCEIVSVPATLSYDENSEEVSSLPIAMCGYHGVFRQFTKDEIEHISTVSDSFITIVMPHAGAEYKSTSDSLREETYRSMIDQGADAVIGNHPHWIQNTESYNGKLIVYSLGNFIFDQRFNEEVTRSMLIDMTISLDYSDELGNYLDVMSDCSAFKDNCRERATENDLTKPVAELEYDVLATRTTNLITKLAPDELSAVLARANWETTKANLE